jgi:hypothetical protein
MPSHANSHGLRGLILFLIVKSSRKGHKSCLSGTGIHLWLSASINRIIRHQVVSIPTRHCHGRMKYARKTETEVPGENDASRRGMYLHLAASSSHFMRDHF